MPWRAASQNGDSPLVKMMIRFSALLEALPFPGLTGGAVDFSLLPQPSAVSTLINPTQAAIGHLRMFRISFVPGYEVGVVGAVQCKKILETAAGASKTCLSERVKSADARPAVGPERHKAAYGAGGGGTICLAKVLFS